MLARSRHGCLRLTCSHLLYFNRYVSWMISISILPRTHRATDGRFSDIFGRKTSMALAMGIYMVGSLLAGSAQSIIGLVFYRGIAGAGGGGIVSIMQIVMSDVVSLRDRCAWISIVTHALNTTIFSQGEVSGNYWRCRELRLRPWAVSRWHPGPERDLAGACLHWHGDVDISLQDVNSGAFGSRFLYPHLR